jgi:hypothetical protein
MLGLAAFTKLHFFNNPFNSPNKSCTDLSTGKPCRPKPPDSPHHHPAIPENYTCCWMVKFHLGQAKRFYTFKNGFGFAAFCFTGRFSFCHNVAVENLAIVAQDMRGLLSNNASPTTPADLFCREFVAGVFGLFAGGPQKGSGYNCQGD